MLSESLVITLFSNELKDKDIEHFKDIIKILEDNGELNGIKLVELMAIKRQNMSDKQIRSYMYKLVDRGILKERKQIVPTRENPRNFAWFYKLCKDINDFTTQQKKESQERVEKLISSFKINTIIYFCSYCDNPDIYTYDSMFAHSGKCVKCGGILTEMTDEVKRMPIMNFISTLPNIVDKKKIKEMIIDELFPDCSYQFLDSPEEVNNEEQSKITTYFSDTVTYEQALNLLHFTAEKIIDNNDRGEHDLKLFFKNYTS